MSTTTTEPTRKNAPRPTPDTPLYPYGDYLADADGYLYKPTGEPDILDGRHATIAAIEAEADDYATRLGVHPSAIWGDDYYRLTEVDGHQYVDPDDPKEE